MNSFKVYDLLPNGVIVFKNQKIAYMNKHLLEVMNLTELSEEDATQIMVKTLSLKKVDELFSYFSKNNYFTHNNKVIQIAQNNHDDIDIFSFMLIDPSLICLNIEKKVQSVIEKNIDAKVANFFKINNIQKIKVLTFYKGLPLKNFAKVIHITKDYIEIEVDNKHKVSLLEKDTILLLNNEKKESSILRGKVISSNNNIFKISNFNISKEDMHQREEIRVKPHGELNIEVKEKSFQLYDISVKGISIAVDNVGDESFLKNQHSLQLVLDDESITLDVKYFKTIYLDEKPLKIVFTLFSNSSTTAKIHKYVVKRQHEIIKEIHKHLEWQKTTS